MNAKNKNTENFIAENRKARHDYFLEQFFEAGLQLEGWEVKSIRAGHVQLRDSYVMIKRGEAWLVGAHITPFNTASTHISPDPQRSRKLLLNHRELDKIIGAAQKKGYTVVPVNLHWKKQYVKVDIALAKGKKQYDKREAEKQKDWERQKTNFYH